MAIARGGSQSDAARAAGVNRSTVMRWVGTSDFDALVVECKAELETEGMTLDALAPLAYQQLKDSLTGGKQVSASQAKLALDVLKAAAAVEKSAGGGVGTLAQRLQELGQGGGD